MIFKLYAYDVWQMDNVSRIIAFIILGIILLLSSFMFQRLKNLIKNLVDKKRTDTARESIEILIKSIICHYFLNYLNFLLMIYKK